MIEKDITTNFYQKRLFVFSFCSKVLLRDINITIDI